MLFEIPPKFGFNPSWKKILFHEICDYSGYIWAVWFQFGWDKNWILAGSLNEASVF